MVGWLVGFSVKGRGVVGELVALHLKRTANPVLVEPRPLPESNVTLALLASRDSICSGAVV